MKNIVAAFIFFTRLPLWRIRALDLSSVYFRGVVNYWSVVGWLTASVMASVLWVSSLILPYSVAIVLALLSRLLLTGGLHEDGLADFFDGFGGGSSKDRILAIMKDSHIGTYGVLSLTFYFLLTFLILSSLDLYTAIAAILVADPLCKFIGSQITLFLPYARNEETSKAKVVYNKMSIISFIVSFVFGVLPLIFLLEIKYWLAAIFPIVIFLGLVLLMKKRIGGYTGDCCGATFLLCELSFFIGILIIFGV